MAADILGQRIGDDVRALIERALPQGSEEGVVDGNGRARQRRIARIAHRFDIDQRVGRVGRAFEVDHRHLPAARRRLRLGLGKHRVELCAGRAGREVDIGDPEAAQHLGDEALAGGVERTGMDDHVVRARIGHHQDADRGHAAAESQRVVGPVPHREAGFEDLLVRPVEARIDKALGPAFAQARDALKVALACGRALEGEGAGEEDRRFQRTFRKHRVVAVAHHQGRRLQRTAADVALGGLGLAAGGGSTGGVGHGDVSFLGLKLPGRREQVRRAGRPFLTSAGTPLRWHRCATDGLLPA